MSVLQNGVDISVVLSFSDEGTPVTGIAPVMTQYLDVTVSTATVALTTLSINEFGNGQYGFTIPGEYNKTYSFKVDGGATLSDADRYVDGVVTWSDFKANVSNLDVPISSRMKATWIEAPDNQAIRAIMNKVAPLKFDDDDNVYSHPKTDVKLQNEETLIDGFTKSLNNDLGYIRDGFTRQEEYNRLLSERVNDIINFGSVIDSTAERLRELQERMLYIKAEFLDSNDNFGSQIADIEQRINEKLDALKSETVTKKDLNTLNDKPSIIQRIYVDTSKIQSDVESIEGLFAECKCDSVDELFSTDGITIVEESCSIDNSYEELFKFDKI